jgi:hypothetical protein
MVAEFVARQYADLHESLAIFRYVIEQRELYILSCRHATHHEYQNHKHSRMPPSTSTSVLTPASASDRESSTTIELLTFVLGIPAAVVALVTIWKLLLFFYQKIKSETF